MLTVDLFSVRRAPAPAPEGAQGVTTSQIDRPYGPARVDHADELPQ